MARPGKALPASINVAGRTYSIIHDSERVKLQHALGLCNHTLLQIHLDHAQHPLALRDTMLHESLHAVSDATQLGLTERQVAVLAGQLLDLLKRNPEFTRWLLN